MQLAVGFGCAQQKPFSMDSKVTDLTVPLFVASSPAAFMPVTTCDILTMRYEFCLWKYETEFFGFLFNFGSIYLEESNAAQASQEKTDILQIRIKTLTYDVLNHTLPDWIYLFNVVKIEN